MKKLFILLITTFSFATASWAQLLNEESVTIVPTENYIYDFGAPQGPVSRMPGFIGGAQGFGQFMVNQIKYPDEAMQKQISGVAVADFIVEPDGSISNVKLVNQLGYGLDDEILRVLMLLPKWSPALDKNNEPMRVEMQIPLTVQPPKPGTFQAKTTQKPVSKNKTGTKKPKKN